MGLMDKLKGLIGKNEKKADAAVDKVADVVDDKTEGKHHEQVEKAADAAHDAVDKLGGD